MTSIEIVPGVSFLPTMPTDTQLTFEVTPEQQKTHDLRPAQTLVVKRDTKTKGDVSELRVAAELVSKGFAVSKPLGENQRYDLVADDGERLYRVQVKTGRIRGDVLVFSCCSTHGHRRTALKTRPYRGQIDLLAMYCPDNGKVYVVPEAELTRSQIYLRLVPPKNNMIKTIRWASMYELA